MKVKFSPEQYKTLIKMLYWSDWMVNGYKSDVDELGEEIEALEQSIYARAKDFGCEEWVSYDKEAKLYYPSVIMQEALNDKIAEYEEYILRREKFN